MLSRTACSAAFAGARGLLFGLPKRGDGATYIGEQNVGGRHLATCIATRRVLPQRQRLSE